MLSVKQLTTNLTIVSVCYNSSELFLSAAWQEFLETTQHAIILVDNSSPDDSGEVLKSKYPQHLILTQKHNFGYGRAANTGIKASRTRYVLLLNPDITISSETIEQLLKVAATDQDDTAIWAPVLNRTGHHSGEPLFVESVTGAAMLFDLHAIQRENLFDDNIFLYSEETDLCYRIRQQGKCIKLCPAIFLDHAVGGSSGHHPGLVYMKAWHFAWSRCYFLEKHQLSTPKRNPKRMYRDYKLKSFISLNKLERLIYRAKAAGVKSFLRGEKAFTSTGEPQMSTFFPCEEMSTILRH